MKKPPLSIGKIRGLSSTSNWEGVFTILALDHRQSFLKMINPWHVESVDYSNVVEVKSQVVRLLGKHSSAVLLDPIYGAAQAISNGACPGSLGLIVAVEESGYTGTEIARESSLLMGWSVSKAKKMGADAVKLLIYYHPDTGELAESQERFVREIIADCRRADISLFLEAVSYSHVQGVSRASPEFARGLPDLICKIARRLGALHPEVLKLEFPVNPEVNTDEVYWRRACERVTESASCPWAVLSGGVEYEVFTRQVEAACKSGASGYIAGRAVWQEAIPLANEKRETWLADAGTRRLEQLNEIASRHAAPWQSYFPDLPDSVKEDWYLTYPD
ncbi:MAG: hypothetical protein A2Z16_04355 [Chloroflexi bacterium RBG_16_54_18]|nr:MAG: hypothetical protein A2Z16_04355 [Chloroflexi bacterium RBG_16_54_18]